MPVFQQVHCNNSEVKNISWNNIYLRKT